MNGRSRHLSHAHESYGCSTAYLTASIAGADTGDDELVVLPGSVGDPKIACGRPDDAVTLRVQILTHEFQADGFRYFDAIHGGRHNTASETGSFACGVESMKTSGFEGLAARHANG